MLITWTMWVVALFGWGYLMSPLILGADREGLRVRSATWLGLSLVLIMAAVVQLLIPMTRGVGPWSAAGTLLGGVLAAARACVKRWHVWRPRLHAGFTAQRAPALLTVALFAVGLIAVARFALAEPTDPDAGGYRIGSVLYAGEFRAIPGLANLHFRFGFDSTIWPFAAFLGNGPWQGQGYRLVTGLFVCLLFADLALRLLGRRPAASRPGDWFIVIAGAFVAAVIFTDAGRWIPSPGQDLCFLIAAIASTAYLADSMHGSARHSASANLAIILAAVAASIRPLGWLLVAATLGVCAMRSASRQRGLPDLLRATRCLAPAGLFAAATLLVMVIRDAVLSGWALYPLRLLPLPVEWRAPDPRTVSDWILSWGRAPGQDAQAVLANNDWIAPWFSGFWGSREVYILRILLLLALLPLLWPRGRSAWRRIAFPLTMAIIPSALLVGAWFLTAPDIRFGWAGVAGVGVLPLAFLLAEHAYPRLAAQVVGVIALSGLLVSQIGNGRIEPRGRPAQPVPVTWLGVELSLRLAPPQTPDVVGGQLGDGTHVIYPAVGNNCWDAFPLCLLPGDGGGVQRRGSTIEDGFMPLD